MQHRRTAALTSVALLTLAACGSGSDDGASPTADEQAVTTDAPAADDFSESETESTAEVDSTEESAPVATEAVAEEAPQESEPAPEEAPVETEPVVDETEAEPVVDDAPEPEVAAEPVLGGRLFAEAIEPAAQFDGNPFPDLVVDDIGKDARVNVANILPSDRPVLLWAWAPH